MFKKSNTEYARKREQETGKKFKLTLTTNGTMAELDVVAESLDRKHLLIGECKWTRKENTKALTKRLNDIAGKLPFAKRGQTVHTCLFLRTQPDTPVTTAYFTPEDILGKGF